MSDRTTVGGCGLVAAGILLSIGGALHPRSAAPTVAGHVDEMLADPMWTPAHLCILTGNVFAAATFAFLLYAHRWPSSVRRWGVAACAATILAAVESVPHLLADHELSARLDGDPTPVIDVHTWLQVLATPAVGLAIAGLATATAITARRLATTLAAAVALVAGIAYALAAPMIALTDDIRFATLFPAIAGLALWLVVAGIGLAVRGTHILDPKPQQVAAAPTGVGVDDR